MKKKRQIRCCVCGQFRPHASVRVGWKGVLFYGRKQVAHWACPGCLKGGFEPYECAELAWNGAPKLKCANLEALG